MNWYKTIISQNQEFDIEQHLRDRGVDIDSTKVYFDKKLNIADFLLYNKEGKLIGFQRYNPVGSKKGKVEESDLKYKTIVPNDSYKLHSVWGMNHIDWNNINVLFITEGIFDAMKIKNMGLPVLALLTNSGNNSLKTQLKLWTSPRKIPIIAILDNDENDSGLKLKKMSDMFFITPDPYKDLGDMPQEKVNEFIKDILNKIGI